MALEVFICGLLASLIANEEPAVRLTCKPSFLPGDLFYITLLHTDMSKIGFLFLFFLFLVPYLKDVFNLRTYIFNQCWQIFSHPFI